MKKYIIGTGCALSLLTCSVLHANEPMHAGLKVCTVSATLDACSMPVETGNEVVRIRFSEYPVAKGITKVVCNYDNTNVTLSSIKGVKGNFAEIHSIIVSDVDPIKGKLYFQLKHPATAKKIKGSIDIEINATHKGKDIDKNAVNISNCKSLGSPPNKGALYPN